MNSQLNMQSDRELVRLNPDMSWPPPVYFPTEDTSNRRSYIELRWYAQWEYYDKMASKNKKDFYFYQRMVAIASLSLPILVTFRPTDIFLSEGLLQAAPFLENISFLTNGTLLQDIIYFITIGLSLTVAFLSGLETLNNYGPNWKSYRTGADDLMQEKFLYDGRIGAYKTHPDPFALFITECEDIIRKQSNREAVRNTEHVTHTQAIIDRVLAEMGIKEKEDNAEEVATEDIVDNLSN